MRNVYIALALLLFCSAACGNDSDSSDTKVLHGPYPVAKRVEGVTVAITASTSSVAPGAVVRFTASATNTTSQRMQIGQACGPSLDVIIRKPDGTELSVLAERGGAFTCELSPRHFADPGETKTETLEWPAASQPGQYLAAAGLRRSDGLGNSSPPIQFTIQ